MEGRAGDHHLLFDHNNLPIALYLDKEIKSLMVRQNWLLHGIYPPEKDYVLAWNYEETGTQ